MIHDLKCWPQYFCRVADGSKTFEVRLNDRGFQPGDEIILREWDPDQETYHPGDMWDPDQETYHPGAVDGGYYTKGRYLRSDPLKFTIGYVLPIDAERVVFSLLPVRGSEK